MSVPRQFLTIFALTLALTSVAGCVTRSVSKPQGAGYGLITKSWTTDFIHWGRRYEIEYWDSKGHRTCIWPKMSHQLVQDGDIALFQGEYQKTLLAAHGAGPAVDITDAVFDMWVKAGGPTFPEGGRSIGDIHKLHHSFTIEVSYIMRADSSVELSREQVLGMVQHAEANGERLEHPVFRTPYLKVRRQE
jgi:hypothetical protein